MPDPDTKANPAAAAAAAPRPLGPLLPGWTPRPLPPRTPMQGRFCAVVPAEAGQAAALHAAFAADTTGGLWTYMAHGPYADAAALAHWLGPAAAADDPLLMTILVAGRPEGIAAFMRIAAAHGTIEIGGIVLSPALQRTPAATEALWLMAARSFDELGYRRLEWKCDALNAPSRQAAARLGYRFEGIFRNHMVIKGRSRDTAWFAMTDADWPAVRAGTTAWLDEVAADPARRQRRPLAAAIAAARAAA